MGGGGGGVLVGALRMGAFLSGRNSRLDAYSNKCGTFLLV